MVSWLCDVVDVIMLVHFFFLMIRRPPRSTLDRSSAASDVYKRQADLEATLRANGFTPSAITVLKEPEVEYEGKRYKPESLVVVAVPNG